ncbi:DUF4434 domain-containing protein [Paenibacillus thermotolerans]|uniref:DUF4434 domain-containing protein n=1 Tax=Paenibacillus thermotolerans TaxID=3027807 RepID=UPI002368346C|nr:MULTISPECIES: DUF4434 domain-containing protein [unclassified Paenibacillus]
MMKKALLGLLAVILVLAAAPSAAPRVNANATAVPYGSFIQPYVSYQWTVEDWKEELGYLKEVGNELLILQWTADTRSKQTIYPTSIPGLTQEGNYAGDPVENLLTAADSLGMQVWLGTNVNDDWYQHHALNEPWLDELFRYSELMVMELWDNYGRHASLAGFYFPNEMENCSYQDDVSIANLTERYASLADLVHTYTGTTLSLAPAIWNERNCGQTFEQNSAAWIKTWDGILGGASIDYLIPQDGLGGAYHTTEEVVEWFRLTKEVVDKHPATRLWVDVETFHTINTSPWVAEPMTTKDIVDHMTRLKPYVDNIVTFSYDHYQAPKLRNSSIFHEAFKHYYETGTVDPSGPAIPLGLVSPKQGTDMISLAWDASPDTFYYIIYRDGVPAGRTYTPGFQDYSLTSGTTYTYQVAAFGASGYGSALSESLQVTTAPSSVNLALHKSYTVSSPASPSYPDTDGKEMTNGIYGADYFWDPQWQGRSTEGTALVYSYTVDLGSKQRIDGMSIDFFQDLQSAIKLPQSVEFFVSDDNVNFRSLGKSPFRLLNFGPAAPDLASAPYGLLLNEPVEAQYVKMLITSSTYAWTFTDELKIEQYSQVNLALNKTYASSTEARAPVPDAGGTELTDGAVATADASDEAWQGRVGVASYSFVVDLGSKRSMREFAASFYNGEWEAATLPTSVSYAVSDDGAAFTPVGTSAAPAETYESRSVYRLESGVPVTGRYVKVTVDTPRRWSLIDELWIVQ